MGPGEWWFISVENTYCVHFNQTSEGWAPGQGIHLANYDGPSINEKNERKEFVLISPSCNFPICKYFFLCFFIGIYHKPLQTSTYHKLMAKVTFVILIFSFTKSSASN